MIIVFIVCFFHFKHGSDILPKSAILHPRGDVAEHTQRRQNTNEHMSPAILTLRLKKLLRPDVLPVANNLIARLLEHMKYLG